MFENLLYAKPKLKQSYEWGCLVPVYSAAELMGSGKHRALLFELKGLSGIPEFHFQALYEQTLNRFAEFVQVLPYEEDEGVLCGLLNRGVARATLALRQYVVETSNSGGADPLVAYALFTGNLFYDIAKVITQFKVVLTNQEGESLDEWQPFIGAIVGKADYYKIYPLTPIYNNLDREAAALLARQLMPREGFLWIASDLLLLSDWLALLQGNLTDGSVRFKRELALYKQDDLEKLVTSLAQMPVKLLQAPATALGDEFLQWLRNQIIAGEIVVGNEDLRIREGNALINNKLLDKFAKERNLEQQTSVIREQFQELFGYMERKTQEQIHKQVGMDKDHLRQREFIKQNVNVKETSGKSLGFLNSGSMHNAMTIPVNLLLSENKTNVAMTNTVAHFQIPVPNEEKNQANLKKAIVPPS